MDVLITGIGDAFTARHFGSSALIDGPEGPVLLDCPDPIHRVIREATEAAGWKIDLSEIHDVIITHLHGDHCNGLESFGFQRRIRHLPQPRLHTTRPVADRLWEKLAPAMDGPIDNEPSTLASYFDVRIITPERESVIAGLGVRCRFTQHPVPTVGLLISDGASTLGWSGDTIYEQAHIDWLSSADLIIHECNHSPAHTPIEHLDALPADLRAKIRLIHLPDDFDVSSTTFKCVEAGEVLRFPQCTQVARRA